MRSVRKAATSLTAATVRHPPVTVEAPHTRRTLVSVYGRTRNCASTGAVVAIIRTTTTTKPTTTIRAAGAAVVEGKGTKTAQTEKSLERLAEIPVEEGVDDRIECRVEVTYPEEDIDEHRRCLRTRLTTHGRCEVPRKKRKPTKQERAHYNTKRLCGFVLALHFLTMLI